MIQFDKKAHIFIVAIQHNIMFELLNYTLIDQKIIANESDMLK